MADHLIVMSTTDSDMQNLHAQANRAMELQIELDIVLKHILEMGSQAVVRSGRLLEEVIDGEKAPEGFEDATMVAQVFSGVFFTGLAIWLLFANGTKLSFVQRASLEKRMTVCCFINTYVAVFSAFFNYFQLTGVDDLALPRASNFTLDFARPLEWLVTCPLMQLVLVLMGGSKIPEYRRTMMPIISAIILCFGTSSMLIQGNLRFIFFGCGMLTALTMWYFNGVQIKEHSGGEENLFKGDSEFRKASVLLIATWFPFPLWFFLSPEGYGLVTDVLIIQIGWAFLNIVSKFTFIFYIQRIKDNYCNRLKVKREMYGMQVVKNAHDHNGDNNSMQRGGSGGMVPATGPAKGQGELNAIIVETMSFLGMAQHTDRFYRLLNRAEIKSPDMVELLTKERCEEMQLPWDLVNALQNRIKVWQLEMRDNAELELEKGEAHYIETDREDDELKAHASMPGAVTALEPLQRLIVSSSNGHMGDTSGLESRLEKMESLIEKQCSMMESQSGMVTAMMQRADGNHQTSLRQVSEAENSLRRRIEYAEQQIMSVCQASVSQRAVQVQPAQSSFDQGALRRLEELVVSSADQSAQRNEKSAENLGRSLQAKTEGFQAAQLRQQEQIEGNLSRKLEEVIVKGESRCDKLADTITQVMQSALKTQLQTSMDNVVAQQGRRTSESEGTVLRKLEEVCSSQSSQEDIARMVENIRVSLHQDLSTLFSRTDQLLEASTEARDVVNKSSNHSVSMMESIRNALQTDVGALLSRGDAIMEAVRECKDCNKEGNADTRRHCMMVLEQVSESQERHHQNTGALSELQRTMVDQNMKVIRCISDVGAGVQSMGAVQAMQNNMQCMALQGVQGIQMPGGINPRQTDLSPRPIPAMPVSLPQDSQWGAHPTTLMNNPSAPSLMQTQETLGTSRPRPLNPQRGGNMSPSYGMHLMGGSSPGQP